MGRRAALKWKLLRAEIESEIALREASVILLQRSYRGRLGRIAAEEKRLELSEFIAQIRATEALNQEVILIKVWKRLILIKYLLD